jgi:hypothetical protein
MSNLFPEHERNMSSNILFVDANIDPTPCDLEFYLPLWLWQQLHILAIPVYFTNELLQILDLFIVDAVKYGGSLQ